MHFDYVDLLLPPSPHIIRTVTLSAQQSPMTLAPLPKVRPGKSRPQGYQIFIGLVQHRSCAGNHSHYKLMIAAVTSHLETNIPQLSSLSPAITCFPASSYNISLALDGSRLIQMAHLQLSTQCYLCQVHQPAIGFCNSYYPLKREALLTGVESNTKSSGETSIFRGQIESVMIQKSNQCTCISRTHNLPSRVLLARFTVSGMKSVLWNYGTEEENVFG